MLTDRPSDRQTDRRTLSCKELLSQLKKKNNQKNAGCILDHTWYTLQDEWYPKTPFTSFSNHSVGCMPNVWCIYEDLWFVLPFALYMMFLALSLIHLALCMIHLILCIIQLTLCIIDPIFAWCILYCVCCILLYAWWIEY